MSPLPPGQRPRQQALLEHHPELHQALATAADCAAVRGRGRTAIELVAALCRHFAARTCLGERDRELDPATGASRLLPSFHTITFAGLWQRVVALAAGWAQAGLVAPGELVGIAGFGSIDWVVADLACLYRGAVSVPLQTSLAAADLRHIVTEAELSTILCSAGEWPLLAEVLPACPTVRTVIAMDLLPGQAAPAGTMAMRAVEGVGPRVAPHQLGPDELATVIYTSGATGLPKGVMYREREWRLRLTPGLFEDIPYVTVGSLPLCHVWGRTALLYLGLTHGGATHFAARGDMSTLFEDIRLVRPTVVWFPPRVANLIYEDFVRDLDRRADAAPERPRGSVAVELALEMRAGYLGDRLFQLELGGAPTPPAIQKFLRECFDVRVVDAYGSTELGSISVNNQVRAGVSYRLESVPELGYSVDDKPYPRGELLVKPVLASAGYFKNAEAGSELVAADGYLRSGDVVEERGPGQVVVIDRRQNVIKLAQGEFVGVARLEELFAAESPAIHQIYVHGDPRRAYLLAVVVPGADVRDRDDTAIRRLVRAELERIARAHRLPRHELPRDFLIEREPFSPENNLLTDAHKLRRRALEARYGAGLAALVQAIDARRMGRPRTGAPAGELVLHAVARTLGLDEKELSAAASFVGLGGDSLGAVELCARLEDLCGAAPPVASVLDPGTSVAALAAQLTSRAPAISYQRIHGFGARPLVAADLSLSRFLPAELLRAGPPPRGEAPRTLLLTGATGFLGRFLLPELLGRGARVVCLVRAADDAAARARVQVPGADGLEVLAGDLMSPRLGLAAAAHEDLAGRVDAIVHAGALVNHALSYRQLFEPNVLGTVELIRFALTGRAKAFHFVSSVAAVAGARPGAAILEQETAAELWPRRPGGDAAEYAVGYGTSKWACEVLLGDLQARTGLPVTILRTTHILPHRTLPVANDADALVRLLRGLADVGLAPESFYAADCREPHVDGVPVDVCAAAIAAIAAAPAASGQRILHVCNARWGDGVSLDRFVSWMQAAGVAISRLPFATWRERFRERLAALDPARRRRSPEAILSRWSQPEGAVPLHRLDNARFRAELRALVGLDDVSGVDEAMFAGWLRALGVGVS